MEKAAAVIGRPHLWLTPLTPPTPAVQVAVCSSPSGRARCSDWLVPALKLRLLFMEPGFLRQLLHAPLQTAAFPDAALQPTVIAGSALNQQRLQFGCIQVT